MPRLVSPLVQPKQISDIRDFLQTARRKDAKCTLCATVLQLYAAMCAAGDLCMRVCQPLGFRVLTLDAPFALTTPAVKIKRSKGVVKFKIRCSRVRCLPVHPWVA